MWIVAPAIVQAPPLPTENDTGRPEDAVAETVKSGSPNVLSARAANVIVWSAFLMANECATSPAGLYFASPGCGAVIVHAPAPVMGTVEPDTEHAPFAT